MKITLPIFLLILIASSAKSQDSNIDEFSQIPEDWLSLETDTYTISYPPSFTLDQSGTLGTKFILFFDSKPGSPFQENIVLVADVPKSGISLEEYGKMSARGVSMFFNDAKIMENKLVQQEDKQEYYLLNYTGKQGQFNLKWLQYAWFYGDIPYVLTLTCEETEYDEYVELGTQVMQSFKFNYIVKQSKICENREAVFLR
ncbi:MAG: hypothetical protein AAF741_16160 [Bacteroidota bacterium]